MSAAASYGAPPRQINGNFLKTLLSAVPRKGPEAAFHRIIAFFYWSDEVWIGFCLFLQSRKLKNPFFYFQ
jgi:hypothetical protein